MDDQQRQDVPVSRDNVAQSTLDRLAAEAKSMLPSINHQPYYPKPPSGPRDITELFTSHAAALQPGQLVKDEFFTLFEAVGALEIMDPKMDSGFIPEGDSFDADFDVEANLDAAQVLWVVNQLMCLEMEWLEGSPLSQTVFTCLYVARLLEPGNREATFRRGGRPGGEEGLDEVLTHKVLRAYCVALIKCLELSMQVIQGQTYYEEEDFVTHLFGRDLLPKVTVEESLQMLNEAGRCLADAESLSLNLRDALEERIFFRTNLLEGLRGMPWYWNQILGAMDDIKASHGLATATPDAFSAKVQRQLATSTPPRPMLNASWDEATTKWRQLLNDSTEACRLSLEDMSINANTIDPQCLQREVWTFASRKPQPTTLARAMLQEQLFHEQGPVATGIGHYELFVADLRNTVLAGDSLVDPASFQVELPSDPRHMRARLLESFAEKVFDEYLNIYRMVCQNRCRIRRLFTQAIGIWDTLETEAAKVDQAMANVPVIGKNRDTLQKELQPLSSWAKMYKLRITAWTIQMGFETEIYMNDELGSMYWYLSHICGSRLQLIHHITHHLTDRIKRRPAALTDCLASKAYLTSTRLHAEATQAMACALSTLLFHLRTLGIIASPAREFSKPQLFHEARMKPYLSVTNDRIPSAADFENARKALVDRTTTEVCAMIDSDIKRAKGLLAELKKVSPKEGKFVGSEEQVKREVKALETTCVAVAVNASQLGRLVEKFGLDGGKGKVDVVMERRWSEWWVVPVVRERKAA